MRFGQRLTAAVAILFTYVWLGLILWAAPANSPIEWFAAAIAVNLVIIAAALVWDRP